MQISKHVPSSHRLSVCNTLIRSDIVTESFKDFLQAIKTLPSPTTRSNE